MEKDVTSRLLIQSTAEMLQSYNIAHKIRLFAMRQLKISKYTSQGLFTGHNAFKWLAIMLLLAFWHH